MHHVSHRQNICIIPRFLVSHGPVGILQALSGRVNYNAEDGKDREDSVDQVKELGLDVLDRDGNAEERADGLDRNDELTSATEGTVNATPGERAERSATRP